VKAGVGGLGAAVLAAPLARSGSAQDAGWQGEIVFYAQAYTPNSKIPNANQLKAFQEVADAYQAEHPGVTIKFHDEQFTDYLQSVRVKGAGKELYDIFWVQSGEVNGVLPKGIARDLTEDYNAPNPYIEGNTAWKDVMNQTVLAYTTAPSGAIYVLDGDFVGTAFFYNTELFTQAGITAPPTTWPELFDACQKLKDAGITVCEGSFDVSWFGRHFMSEFYAPDYETIAGCDGTPGQSPQDEAAAIKSGLLSTNDPRFMGWWPFFKKFTDFWSQEYLAQDLSVGDAVWAQNFATGSVAMFYSGSWIPRNLQTLGIDFELGSFSFPKLTKDDIEFATGTDVSAVVGGPNAAYQYAMSTKDSNKTLEEEGKEAAVLDWLHYIGTPEVIEKVVNELGSFAPTWPGTTPVEGLETFAEQANTGLKVVNIGNTSAKLNPSWQKTFGLYLSGNTDIDSATSQMQTELDRAVQDYERANPDIDIDSCSG
jgi:raffinose/stachyose/melibiose transport system substrate-binding protein